MNYPTYKPTLEDAVDRWFLTSHERAAITQALKEMCGIGDCDRVGTHKEARATRVIRDEKDAQKLVATFNSSVLNDLFHIPDDIPNEELPLSLSNLATGVILPDADADKLLAAEDSGRQNMKTFISSRLQTNEINFGNPIKKMGIKSLCSVAKKIAVKNQKDKIVSINADRELFSRLLVAAKNREIDLKEVLSYELCIVPIALHIFKICSARRCGSKQAYKTNKGCDSTSAFSGIGKKKAWKVLLKNKHLHRDLSSLGESPTLLEPVQKISESFICSIYTIPKVGPNDVKTEPETSQSLLVTWKYVPIQVLVLDLLVTYGTSNISRIYCVVTMPETSSASSTVAPVTQRVLVMPEAFSNGDNEDWASWLCYSKKCAKLNKWDDEQQRDFLSVRLRASALEIFLGLSEDTQNGVFRELVDALTEKKNKSDFNARRRGQDEKLIDLSAAIGN
ncbi:hypothetical protein QZH41_000769 [Actinostola sp. cb2023]|nr:hypothetical protein QZH41_000769 [Actinostola sp. cb2023]